MMGCPLFFDLDGPLLDVRKRYHAVYAGIARELGAEPLPLEIYWEGKRRREPLEWFFRGLAAGTGLRDAYLQRWLPRIEAPEWLVRDTLVPGALACLQRLGESHSLYLVTLRRDPDAVRAQIAALGLQHYFKRVLTGWAAGAGSAELKASWIQSIGCAAGSAIVGDSEVDVEAAHLVAIPAIGVSFGIREPAELIALGAAHVVDRLSALPGVLADLPRHARREPGAAQRI